MEGEISLVEARYPYMPQNNDLKSYRPVGFGGVVRHGVC